MKNKYNQELPHEVETQLDEYIERIKSIQWFCPSPDLKRTDIDRQVSIALKAFGLEASVEYRTLKTQKDWGAAQDAAQDAAWDAAQDAAWDAAWDASWGAALDAALNASWCAAQDAAWDAAWDASWGAADVLALNLDDYKKKYPTGNFIHLIPLWEAGLYPCGVIGGKFIIYVPPVSQGFPQNLID